MSCSAHSLCLPFHPLIDLVLQWVLQLKRSGLNVLFFGAAPSPVSRAHLNAGDWYETAREAFAELDVDQESVDAVFGVNAQRIYAAGSNGRA